MLVLLGILFIVLNVVLWLPAKYRVKANATGDIKSVTASVKAFWLFHLFQISATYENGKFQWKARAFWKTISQEDLDVKKDDGKEKQEERKDSLDKIKETEDSTKGLPKEREVSKSKKSPKKNFKTRINKIKCTIKELYDKIKWIWKNKDDFIAFVNDEGHQKTFRNVMKDILSIVKHYLPRKCKGYLKYGLEDPYQTGQILAVLSIIYPFYGKEFDIYPDFEESILEGDLLIKGRIRAIHFLRLLKYLFFDKTVKDLIKYVKKHSITKLGGNYNE